MRPALLLLALVTFAFPATAEAAPRKTPAQKAADLVATVNMEMAAWHELVILGDVAAIVEVGDVMVAAINRAPGLSPDDWEEFEAYHEGLVEDALGDPALDLTGHENVSEGKQGKETLYYTITLKDCSVFLNDELIPRLKAADSRNEDALLEHANNALKALDALIALNVLLAS